ncbi:MAG: uncharacterized protein QOC93_1282 [Actinomycetota bacterium]|nr:uncharacterized protein [Actinomycetota bacterium]
MAMPSPMPTVSRRSRVLLMTVVVLLVLALVGSSLVSLLADWYWFGEVDFRSVFTTTLWTRLALFASVGLLTGAFVAVNLALAYRLRPSYRPMSLEQQNLDRYRLVITPRIRSFITLASVACGLIAGLTAQGQWRTWLLYVNATPFGEKDPQFGKDISFYVFEYPMYRYVLGVAFAAVVLAGMGALFLHWLYGGVRLQGTGERMTDRARGHLWALLAVFLVLKAVAYYLDRYGLVLSSSDLTKVFGASYSDVHYLLPVKNILLFVSAFAALMFVVAIARRSLLLPGVALALLGLLAVLLGGVFPFVAEQVYVKPNAKIAEAPYIKRNIDATREAYGLAGIQRQVYDAKTTATREQLRADQGTIPNARLLDPAILAPTFTQTQQVRSFYDFNDKLDIDRYTIDGKTQDYVVGVRELDTSQLTGNQGNWINRHTVYTHGNGFVAAPANTVNSDGLPCFVSGGLAGPQPNLACGGGKINVKEPRVYYGELFHGDYAVVGKQGGADQEFDRPTEDGGQVNTTYSGRGGVPVGTLARKVAYGLYFKERNFLLSNALNENSKVIYVRDPRSRVEKVAPFLTVDGDPYPAVVGGKVVWIIDGYTTSDAYPYAQRETLGDAVSDSRTGTGNTAQPRDSVNYIRNSVKATVDAYDGTVKLYEWDTKDPVLKTWNKAFGGIVEPRSAIGADLLQHFRYPEDMFKLQRTMLASYHVGEPGDFFSGQNFWKVPSDPTQTGTAKDAAQPPYYLLAQFPGQEQSTFQLTTALTAAKRENLAAIMTASYDAEGATRLQVLELPASSPILGPVQMQSKFLGTEKVAQGITLFKSQRLHMGNLLTLPVGGGLLYIEPFYVQSTSGSSYPTLQKVLVGFGDNIAYENTLPEALDSLFGQGTSQPTAPSTGNGSGTTAGSGTDPDVATAVRAIKSALDALRTAQQKGDFAGIGKAQEDLAAAVKQFDQARTKAAAVKPRTSATPSRSAPTP